MGDYEVLMYLGVYPGGDYYRETYGWLPSRWKNKDQLAYHLLITCSNDIPTL